MNPDQPKSAPLGNTPTDNRQPDSGFTVLKTVNYNVVAGSELVADEGFDESPEHSDTNSRVPSS